MIKSAITSSSNHGARTVNKPVVGVQMSDKTHSVVLVSANYPDRFHLWGQWNKSANLAISRLEGVDLDIVAPKPYALPFKFLPYNEMCSLPLTEQSEEGMVHYPRFPYLLPKKVFYGVTGDLYGAFVSRYMLRNLSRKDLIHSHHAFPDAYGLIGVSKKWRAPLVVDIHGDGMFTEWLVDPLIQHKVMKTLQYASKIICISKNIESSCKQIGLDEEKIIFIPLGTDLEKFRPGDRAQLRQEFSINEEIVILYVGQLIPRKGVICLLSAIAVIDRALLNKCRFLIVGGGPDKAKLIESTKATGIDKQITFTGKVSDDQLIKLYAMADIFVLPSLSEGRPIAINEAMASECAVIATNISGIPEQVTDGYNGLLIERKNPIMLAEKLTYLLDHPDEARRMGKNGRKRIIEEGWTWENYANNVINVYDSVINTANGSQ